MSTTKFKDEELELPLSHDNFFASLDKKLENDKEDNVYKFQSVEEIISTDYPPEQWLVHSIIPKDGITCIAGLPATTKSYFSNYLALCIAEGKLVLDRFNTDKANILFIDKENKLSRIKNRFVRLGISTEASKKIFFLASNFLIDNPNDLGTICSFIRDHDIKLTFIDTLIRIHTRNENEASEINKVFISFKEILLAGSGICFIHHFNKRGSFGALTDVRDQLRGSGDILAMVDSFIALTRKEGFIEVEQAKSRDEQNIPKFLMQPYFEKDKTFFNYIRNVEQDERIESIMVGDQILALLSQGTNTRKFLKEQLGNNISVSTMDRALKQLKNEERIITYTNGDGSHMYSINRQLNLE